MPSTAISRSIMELETVGGLKGADIANATGVSKATVSRWRTGAKRPQPASERVFSDLVYVVRRLEDYYANDQIRTWLYARHPQLEGRRAIDLIHMGRVEEIFRILYRLDADGYL